MLLGRGGCNVVKMVLCDGVGHFIPPAPVVELVERPVVVLVAFNMPGGW